MSRPLSIHLHDIDNEIHQITVQLHDPIYILENCVPRKEKRLLTFNGQLLICYFSFAHYNIADGAHIYAVHSKVGHPHTASAYFEHNMKKRMRRDNAELSSSCRQFPHTFVREVARLHDLRNMRSDRAHWNARHSCGISAVPEDSDRIERKCQLHLKKLSDVKRTCEQKPYCAPGQ